jgi:uncharacterized protein (TIGR02391 family)
VKLISKIFPVVETALQLEPEELAVPLLECLCQMEEDRGHSGPNLHNFMLPANLQEYTGNHYKEFTKVATEAWMWLLHEGLIARNPEQGGDWVFVTRRGKKFRKLGDVEKFRAANMLPHDTLDPILAAKVRPPFLRGDYDSAIFEAFKEVEIRVRNLSGMTKDDIGVPLMRKAFKPGDGPLIDANQTGGEQQGVTDLFAGAIGSFKNPSSHRDVDINDPVETVELIGFADLLLRIADRRKPSKVFNIGRST